MYKFPLFPLPHGSNPKFLKFQILHNYNPPNEGGKKNRKRYFIHKICQAYLNS